MNWSDPEHDVLADVQRVHEESQQRILLAVTDGIPPQPYGVYGDRDAAKVREHIEREIVGPAKRRGEPEVVDGSYVFRVPARSGKDRSLRGKARKKARRRQ